MATEDLLAGSSSSTEDLLAGSSSSTEDLLAGSSSNTYALPSSAEPAAGTGVLSRLGRDLTYNLVGLPLGIAAFAVSIAGFAAGVGTFVVWLGLPILAGTLAAARGFAGLERSRVQTVTGRPLPPHHYREPSGAGLVGLLRRLLEPQSWRDLLHAVLAFPLRVAAFAITVAWSIAGLGGLLYVLWEWSLPGRDTTLPELAFGWEGRLADIAFTTMCGAVLLVTMPFVVRALTTLQTGLARGVLTNQTAALRARATGLAAGRRAAVQAESQTLRRVERDIHDGPQQRLVRLNMDLETAARRLDDDPQRARPLVAEALEQSREALAELRAVSRGIAPPILADRGLEAALAAAAARCPVEVVLDVALEGRQPEVVEQVAYFVVAEALTNIAKHSGATRCTVAVDRDADQVRVRVTDDGRGGAHVGKGHGLAGLADRLATVDGWFDVHSLPGGPTILSAGIPLTGLNSTDW